MKPSLHLATTQQLSMTPQLQQAIRLLQLSSIDLLAEIQQQLDSNPLLEQEDPDFDAATPESQDADNHTSEEPAYEDDWSELSFAGNGDYSGDDDDAPQEQGKAAAQTLADHLLWQLRLARLSQLDFAIGYCLIDALDTRGYLVEPLEDVAEACRQLLGDACPEDSPEEDEIIAVLHRIQQFEPTGVAARSLSECLRLQLHALPEATPYRQEALTLLTKLGDKADARLLASLRPDDPATGQLLALLRQLDPAPGESFIETEEEVILPDVIVSRQRGRWQARLNPQLQPKLSINRYYAEMAQSSSDAKAGQYLRDQLQEARWFIKSLQSRQETLLKVSRTLLTLQQDFFNYGEEAMKPLVLADVAEKVGMHESTISRVTTQKYMHTPRGLFELKYFFSSHVATDGGGECSSTAIRAIIKKLVTAEDPRKPLSDNKLTDLLNEQGIQVARRTVAKYREALRIPSSSERKRPL